jgi:hypothetical protein
VRESGGVPRVQKLAHEIGAIADHTAPELRALGDRLDRAITRIEGLSELFDASRREQLRGALAAGRRAVAIAERMTSDVRALMAMMERGEGTLGGLAADQELFDDLHETHRILKAQPWTFFLKPGGADPRRPAGPTKKLKLPKGATAPKELSPRR